LRLPCCEARVHEPLEMEACGVGVQPGPVGDVLHPEWTRRLPQQNEDPCAAFSESRTGVGCHESPDVHERTLLQNKIIYTTHFV